MSDSDSTSESSSDSLEDSDVDNDEERYRNDLSTDDLGDQVQNESWAEGVDNVTCLKSAATSPNGRLTDVEHEIYAQLHNLDLERNALMREIQTEDNLRERFYQQLEILSQRLETLPLSDTYNLQTDMTRRQVEYEAKKLEEAMTEKFGTSEHISQRQEARLQRIRNIEAEMLILQQRHNEQQLLKQQRNLNQAVVARQNASTNTALCGEIFILKPGCDNARTSDRVVTHLPGGVVRISIGVQTSDVIIQENPDILQANMIQTNNLSSIYHGSWPIGKEITNHGAGGIPDTQGQDLASVMSFNSTNTCTTNGSLPLNNDLTRSDPNSHQQLGTKVEMVYSLLSMLGTHDKDDMSRTLLAMSSSQDSCIAMRQSGCLPLLIQLLHGSDKESGLLGNTRGSKSARARASAALHNIVHSHPDDKRGRREARVLRLLEQIRAHCDQLKGDNSDEEEEPKTTKVSNGAPRPSDIDHHPGPAIAALMKLSFDEEHRHAICTLGGLQAIAELLEVDHDANGATTEQYNITMRRYACMALTNLTFGDGTNKALLCSMKGPMEGLVAQLTSPNEDLCQVAASVLRNLSWRADLASKKTLREVNAVTTLTIAAMQIKKESTLKSILSALWNLSAHCTENKADICAVPGALEFLVSTLTYKSPSKTLAIIENGGGILRNVSSHVAVREDYRQVLRQHGCLQLLLKHLRSTSLTIVSNACGTLWNLSARCQEDQQSLWEMGAVSMLRNLVHSKHKMISMGSAAALKNLLSARPAMKNLDLDRLAGCNRPGLHARKVRALEQELDQNLAETCENVESPRNSPTEKKDNAYTRRFSGDNIVVFPTNETEPRRSLIRGHVFPRSGSSDSAGDNKLRSPQRVARSGSQDSVGSTHSDISHDRSRVHSMLAKSSRLLHERQGSSLERKRDGRGNPDNCSADRSRIGAAQNNRILEVMQEVSMHPGLPSSSEKDSETARTLAYQAAQIKAGNFGSPQRNLIDQFAKKPFNFVPNAKDMYVGQKRINIDINDAGADGDEQPINYSLKYQDVGASANLSDHQLNNRPQVKFGNFVGPNMAQRPMPNIVHNQFHVAQSPRNAFEPRHRNIGAHQSMSTQYGCYAETDIDADDQPTNFSLRYAENVEESFQDQPINYSMRYQEADPGVDYSQRYQGTGAAVQYKQRYAEVAPPYKEREDSGRPCFKQIDSRYQEAEPGSPYKKQNGHFPQSEPEQTEPYEDPDPNCADCKLEEARRTNDRLDEYMPSFFLDDQIKTFCTEGTPYLSTATSLTDLTGKIHYKEDGKKDSDDTEDESKSGVNEYEEETSGSGSRSTDLGTGSTMKANPEHQVPDDPGLEREEPDSPPVEQSFHSTTEIDGPLDQPKTYCEEGTPVCFSRVSSLSSLHSSEARDLPDQHGRHQLVLSSIEESEKGENMSVSVIENCEARKPNKELSETPSSSEVVEKEHKTVTFDDHHHVEETPLMFSRCSSLGSLSSFDVQSVHSSVVSEYSRRASEVVSPSELPDSPSETMPTSPKPEAEDKVEDDEEETAEAENDTPTKFTSSIVRNSNIVQPVQSFAALMAVDALSDMSKTEAPVVYADEGTPPTMSDRHSILSALTVDDEAMKKSKRGENLSDETKMTNHLNEENSSMSEVSEGEEDILAQCISSAMPVSTNSSRKMRKSSSDNALKKKSSIPKPESPGSSIKSKLPTKIHSNTLDSSKSRLPQKDQKSPVGKSVPRDGICSPVKPVNQGPGTPVKLQDRKGGSRIAQSVGKSPTHMSQSLPRSPQTPRGAQNTKPLGLQTPKSSHILQTPPSRPLHQFSPTKQVPSMSTPNHATQYGSNVQTSTRPPYQSVDYVSYSPDFNQDTVTTYATEGTPLNFSNANSVSDLSALSFDETTVHFRDSPMASASKNEDVRSDNSSLCEESEELVSQVIQAAMPKSKVARRLDMDRQAEGAEDRRRKPTVQVPPNVKVSPSSTLPSSFQPQRTSSVAAPTMMPVVKPCESVDSVKTFAVEGTPLNFSNATSLSDLTIDSTDEAMRMSEGNASKFAGMQPSNYGQNNESVFHGVDSLDSPQVYHVEDTPLTFSRNDSLSSLSMFSCDVSGQKNVEASDNVSSSSSSIPKERHVVGQSSEESSVIDQTNKDNEDNCNKFAIEDTPACFSRNSSLSSLHSPEPDRALAEDSHQLIADQKKPFKEEDTPAVFSRNSSLSELSVESTAFDPTPSEQALLDECISSAMPKSSRTSRDERSQRSTAGRGRVDRHGKKLSKSASLDLRPEMIEAANDSVFKKPSSKLMSYSCSDAEENAIRSTDSYPRYNAPLRGPWNRSHSQDNGNFLKDQKNNSNSEIAKHWGRYHGSVDALEEMALSYDNRMLEEARALRDKLLMASVDSGVTNSVTEKMDSEKSHLGDSFLENMALTNSTQPAADSVDHDNTEFDSSATADENDTTVLSANSADETVLCKDQRTDGSFEEEISPEDVLLLEENASLIVSELSTNQMTESACDDDMFIENETLSLVSNDYTSDTASEISVSWSNTSEKVSEYSGSTISQTESTVSSQKGPKIVKPGKNQNLNLGTKPDPGAVRGRRKPLYHNKSSSSSVKSTSTTKSDVSVRPARPVTNTKSVLNKSQSPGLKKPPQKPQTSAPSATSTPNKASANKRLSRSPVSTNRSSSASSIPRSPLSKTSPCAKVQQPKDSAAKSKADRPKPPIKQGTFTKDTTSVNAPKIDPVTESENVKLRDKQNSSSASHRNSAGSERNSGSPPEAWSKALDGFNFIVDSSQENGSGPPYKQMQMQRNSKEAAAAVKRNNSPAAKKPSNLARPIQGQSTPPRSNSKGNLNKAGSGSNLRKTSSGTSLSKTQSGSNLNKTNSGSSLNKGGSASNLKKPDSKSELKKSDSNASLKNNSRPSTPVGRKSSNSSINYKKTEVTPGKSVTPTGDKKSATPTSDKKPPTGNKKQVPSKIATLWKKEDGDSPPSNVSRLPVVSVNKTKQSPKPTGLPTPTQKTKPSKPAPPKRTDSLSKHDTTPKEGIHKSSTYDKISTDLNASDVPTSDATAESDPECEAAAHGHGDLNVAFHESPSITMMLSGDDCAKSDNALAEDPDTAASFYSTRLEDRLTADGNLTCSVDSLDDISMHSLPVNSGTWKKKHCEGSLTLPNADETCRSVPSSLSTIVNQSCDESDMSMSNGVWKKYGESNGHSVEPQIWVKRDSKKDKTKSKVKKESKSVAQSIKSTLFGKKPTFGKIFGSQKNSSKDKKVKDEQKVTENCRNLLANPKAGSLWQQESRTSPSAIVSPFNYSPPANSTVTKQEAVVAPSIRSDPGVVPPSNRLDTSLNSSLDGTRQGPPVPSNKHATKTEMLLARRRQSYLNNSMKIEESVCEEDNKRPCMVTTV